MVGYNIIRPVSFSQESKLVASEKVLVSYGPTRSKGSSVQTVGHNMTALTGLS